MSVSHTNILGSMPGEREKSGWSRALGRWWRALGLHLTGPPVEIVFSPEYGVEFPGARSDPRRAERILSFLSHERLVPPRRVHRPRRGAVRRLRRVHGDTYLDALQSPGGLVEVLGYRADDDVEQEILEAQKWMVGGTLLATKLALERGRLAVNLGGGFHHAMPDRGAGFCAFHDVAVAIREARHRGFEGKVLVVDLDLHDGDGTRAIFAEDPSVHTLSIHNRHWGSTDAVESTSVQLGDDVGDDAYLPVVRERLAEVTSSFKPDLVYYVAGCDPAEDDTLGNWRVSADGMLERDRTVLSTFRDGHRRVPTVVVLAGGYGRNAWRYTARTLGWALTGGTVIEPPSTRSLTLARYRKLARGLRTGDLVGEPTSEDWSLKPEDILPALTSKTTNRFLGFYSIHGLEVALERYGYLAKIRALGFHDLKVECDLDESAGDTLRIFARSHPAVPVAEVRVRRDARTIEGMELLHIEWLRLQNPSVGFTRDRPPLPGQNHPGLGLLRDTTAILMMACERLGLDGISFVAGHYHLVAQSREYMRFAGLEDEVRFRATRKAVKGLSLAEATRAVDCGRVIDRATGDPVAWVPPTMVVPVSDRLKSWFEDSSRGREADAAAMEFDFGLAADPEEDPAATTRA
jgi:acetoin utilization deacetylase AcuC-like enzyme